MDTEKWQRVKTLRAVAMCDKSELKCLDDVLSEYSDNLVF